MKQYVPRNRVTAAGFGGLLGGALASGVILGSVGYYISHVFYFIGLLSFGVALVCTLVYSKLVVIARVRHPVLCPLIAALMGLAASTMFHLVPYVTTRTEFVAAAQRTKGADAASASHAFDTLVRQKAGLGGMLGFMILRAHEGEEHSLSFWYRLMPMFDFSFTLTGIWVWLHWLFEASIIIGTIVFIAVEYSQSFIDGPTNKRYGFATWLGEVSLDAKERFFESLRTGDLDMAGALLTLKSQIGSPQHPTLELYEQHVEGSASANTLLTIKETARNSSGKVERITLQCLELSALEYERLTGAASARSSEGKHENGPNNPLEPKA